MTSPDLDGPRRADLEAWGLDPGWSRHLDVADGDGVHRWHVLDTGPVPSGAGTLVCVHGNPTWAYIWSPLLRRLHDRYRVIAVDQLGMGFSERTVQRRYATRVRDLDAVIQALDVDRSSPLILAGHDWGGAIALGWAVDHVDEVTAIVLGNTGIAVPDGRRAPWLIRLASSPALLDAVCRGTPVFVEGTIRLGGTRLSPTDRRALRAPYRSAPHRAAIADFVGDVPLTPGDPSERALADVAERLPTLELPVLLAWGSRDPVFGDDFAADLAARLPRTVLHRFARASHLVTLEADVATVADDFIDDVLRRRDSVTEVAPTGGAHVPLWSGIDRAVERDGAATAFVDLSTGDAISFAGLQRRVERIAQDLVVRGLAPGDRVAMLVPPGPDLVAAVFGVWRAGGVTVVADRGLGLRGLGAAVRSARPRFVIGPSRARGAARLLRWAPRASAIDVAELGSPGATGAVCPQPHADDAAAVLFTSGATGPAKGVRYTHGQLAAQRDALAALFGVGSHDRLVAAFAPFALYGPALGIPTAVPACDVTSPATLTASALAEACELISATMVFASPAALANVVATASSGDHLRSARLVMSAGAPVAPELLERVRALVPDAEIHTPYGMTEVLPVADIELGEILSTAAPDTGVCVGRAVDGCTVRLLPTDIGAAEIAVRAPWMSAGYDGLWKTERDARPTIDGEVWHRTGDVGHIDDDGRLWVEGRLVHVITSVDGPITPVPVERAAELAVGRRAAAVGVGPAGIQQLVVVVERPQVAFGLADAATASAVRSAVGHSVAAVLAVPRLPVDVRHNAKIDRTVVARWASQVVAGRHTRKPW